MVGSANHISWDVFRTAAGDGGLYFFPGAFSYSYVAVNKEFIWLTVEFGMRESITVRDLLLLYEENEGAYLGLGIPSVVQFVCEPWFIQEFFDMESGHVNFDSPEFVSHIETALQAFRQMPEEFTRRMQMQFDPNFNPQQFLARYFMFNNIFSSGWSFEMHGFFEDCYFGYALPLVNSDGELYIMPNPAWFLNTDTTLTQQALALDFVRFTHDTAIPEVWHHHINPDTMSIGGISVNHDMFRRQSNHRLRNSLNVLGRSGALRYPVNDAVEMFTERIYANINRPFARLPYVPASLRAYWTETWYQLRADLISTEEAAWKMPF